MTKQSEQVKDDIAVEEGILMKGSRIIIPVHMRKLSIYIREDPQRTPGNRKMSCKSKRCGLVAGHLQGR